MDVYHDMLFALLLVVIFFIELPLQIIGCLALARDWYKTHFIKRHRILIISFLVSMSAIVYIYIPSVCIEFILTGDSIIFGIYGTSYFFVPCMYFSIFFTQLRFWLLYFDINLSKWRLQKEWLCVIDPKFNENDENWFVLHQFTFGNSKYLLKCGTISIIIISIISAILRSDIFNNLSPTNNIDLTNIERLLAIIISLSSVIIMIPLTFKIKNRFYNDNLGIKKELFSIVTVCMIYGIIYGIMFGLYWFNIINWYYYNLLWCFNAVSISIALLYLTTLKPTHLNASNSNSSNSNKTRKFCNCNYNTRKNNNTNSTNSTRNNRKAVAIAAFTRGGGASPSPSVTGSGSNPSNGTNSNYKQSTSSSNSSNLTSSSQSTSGISVSHSPAGAVCCFLCDACYDVFCNNYYCLCCQGKGRRPSRNDMNVSSKSGTHTIDHSQTGSHVISSSTLNSVDINGHHHGHTYGNSIMSSKTTILGLKNLGININIGVQKKLHFKTVSGTSTPRSRSHDLSDIDVLSHAHSIRDTLHYPIGFYWYDIVSTEFGFESLMHHLVKEFSVENLLIISEVCYVINCQ